MDTNNIADAVTLSKAIRERSFEMHFPDCSTDEELLEVLGKFVLYLLDKQPERLWQILYRLDVDEMQVKQVLMNEQNDNEAGMGKALAQLVIEREKKRQYYRQQYARD